MSISAMKPSVLSGSASRYGAIRSRSATMSALVRSISNSSASDGSARLVAHVNRRQRVDAVRGAVLERQLAGLVEEDVDDHALRRREHDLLDELLVLDVAAVAADELHPRARQRDLEDRVLAVLVR